MPPDDKSQDDPALDPAKNAASGAASDDNGSGEGTEGDQDLGEQSGGDSAAGADRTAETAAGDEPAAQAKPAKNPIKPFQNRIDELTRARRDEERQRVAAEARAKTAEDRLAALQRGEQQEEQPARQTQEPPPGYVPQELVHAEAARLRAEEQFNTDSNATFAKGVAAHTDFEDAMATAGAMGVLQREVIEDAIATDAPHEVLYQLGKDPEEAQRIMKLPRNRRIAEFTKMTLKAPAKTVVSRAPAPIKPVNGNAAKDFDFNDPSADDAEWHARMDAQEREQRAARR